MTRSKSILVALIVLHEHTRENLSRLSHTLELRLNPCLTFVNSVLFVVQLVPHFLAFLCFFGGCWFNCLKCRAEVLFSIPISSRPWCVVWRKYVCYIHKLHWGMSPTAAGHQLNTNGPTVHQKRAFLNRTTQNKVRYWPVEENVSRGYRKLIVHFPQGPRFNISNSMLSVTL